MGNHLPALVRKRIRVSGIVQGVGFRPFVWQRATACGLVGWVHNTSAGVTIEIQGEQRGIAEFLNTFQSDIPPLAVINSLAIEEIPTTSELEFNIRQSLTVGEMSSPVSPDIAVCEDCLREMESPEDRRYAYPFINCLNCGPRFTIVEDIPYDRASTTMRSFPMCDACLLEYHDPASRRFHAQPNACPECGPHVWFVREATGEHELASHRHSSGPLDSAAIEAFHAAIATGQTIAVKGIGGFHLVCDATSDLALTTLRERKGRIDKPFAIMVANLNACRKIAYLSAAEEILLESQARPILLLRKKPASLRATKHNLDGKPSADSPRDEADKPLSELVAPHNDFVGILLPYSPLHHLLLKCGRPLVMTSGNLTDEPIVRENREAQQRLSRLADGLLLHDRDIANSCDDSVVRCVGHALLPLRRSRGYAPVPIELEKAVPSVLAVGGELKATFCATKDQHAYMSAHIGDMGNLETLEAMQRGVDHLLRLFRIQPQAIVADLHPNYLSTNWAKQFGLTRNIPLIQVQHHHAHLAALMAEHRLPADQPILGCCFDGTGYGVDHTTWGGEFLIVDAHSFHRLAHLKTILMPGGDESIRRPYRVALSHLLSAGLSWDTRLPCAQAATAAELRIINQQLKRNVNCTTSSSMGRLFDAVASLIGVRQHVNYEAQAAMELEWLAAQQQHEQQNCNGLAQPEGYHFLFQNLDPIQIDPQPVLKAICSDVITNVPASIIADRFHQAVAHMITQICCRGRAQTGINTVGISGGVFQNVLLLELAQSQLREQGFRVLVHQQVPPNDGGIALGQAFIACQRLLQTV